MFNAEWSISQIQAVEAAESYDAHCAEENGFFNVLYYHHFVFFIFNSSERNAGGYSSSCSKSQTEAAAESDLVFVPSFLYGFFLFFSFIQFLVSLKPGLINQLWKTWLFLKVQFAWHKMQWVDWWPAQERINEKYDVLDNR